MGVAERALDYSHPCYHCSDKIFGCRLCSGIRGQAVGQKEKLEQDERDEQESRCLELLNLYSDEYSYIQWAGFRRRQE